MIKDLINYMNNEINAELIGVPMRYVSNHGRVNIRNLGNSTNIFVVVPGYIKKDLDISVEGAVLTVSTVKDFKGGEEDYTYHSEYVMWPFKRSFDITNYDIDSIETSLKNGILTISLKKEDKNIQKVPIK